MLAQAGPRSKTTGLMVGVGLNGSSIKFENDDEADSGSGATLQLGYGFTRRFTLMIDVSGVVLDGDPGEGEVSLAQVFLAGRFNFRSESARWRPFAEVGLGARGLGEDNVQICDPTCANHDFAFTGGAFMFGGGVSFYATRKFAITGALNWGVGEFSDARMDNVTVSGFEADATTARLNLGVSWFPGR
jgi:hypothetical protein